MAEAIPWKKRIMIRLVTLFEKMNAMEKAGVDSPQGEALCLMSMLEGESLFTGEGRRWEKNRGLVRDTILKFVENRYGKRH